MGSRGKELRVRKAVTLVRGTDQYDTVWGRLDASSRVQLDRCVRHIGPRERGDEFFALDTRVARVGCHRLFHLANTHDASLPLPQTHTDASHSNGDASDR